MATIEEFRTQVDDFANTLADEVDAVQAKQLDFQNQIDDLKGQLAVGNTQAVSDALDTLAPDMSRLQDISTKLRELGSSSQPIPDPLPPATP